VGAHWFDRLARTRAASSQPAGSAELTRRDALARAGAATLGLSALGALPVAASASPRTAPRAHAAQLAACGACTKDADKQANHQDREGAKYALISNVIPGAAALGSIFAVSVWIGSEARRYYDLRKCADGVCNPQSMNPTPSANPATDVNTGAAICPGGTHDCGAIPGSTTHYCCFGDDVCCNGTCCIADVGCACAPS
jgi:hypothetical protein